jgi:hypothetical protein
MATTSDWLADKRQHYFVKRAGLRWRVYFTGSDGLERPLHPISGCFWLWITAERMAQSLNTAHNDGLWIASEHTAKLAANACVPRPQEAWSREAVRTGELIRRRIGQP